MTTRVGGRERHGAGLRISNCIEILSLGMTGVPSGA
jgi:hypothetical protein